MKRLKRIHQARSGVLFFSSSMVARKRPYIIDTEISLQLGTKIKIPHCQMAPIRTSTTLSSIINLIFFPISNNPKPSIFLHTKEVEKRKRKDSKKERKKIPQKLDSSSTLHITEEKENGIDSMLLASPRHFYTYKNTITAVCTISQTYPTTCLQSPETVIIIISSKR